LLNQVQSKQQSDKGSFFDTTIGSLEEWMKIFTITSIDKDQLLFKKNVQFGFHIESDKIKFSAEVTKNEGLALTTYPKSFYSYPTEVKMAEEDVSMKVSRTTITLSHSLASALTNPNETEFKKTVYLSSSTLYKLEANGIAKFLQTNGFNTIHIAQNKYKKEEISANAAATAAILTHHICLSISKWMIFLTEDTFPTLAFKQEKGSDKKTKGTLLKRTSTDAFLLFLVKPENWKKYKADFEEIIQDEIVEKDETDNIFECKKKHIYFYVINKSRYQEALTKILKAKEAEAESPFEKLNDVPAILKRCVEKAYFNAKEKIGVARVTLNSADIFTAKYDIEIKASKYA